VAEIAVTELGYVGLGVSDLSRWRVFAREVPGMECVEVGENPASAHGLPELPYPASPRRSVDNRKRGGVRGLDRPKDPLNQVCRAHPEAAWDFLPSPAVAAGPIGAAGGEAVP
jgi:hypothetical protein